MNPVPVPTPVVQTNGSITSELREHPREATTLRALVGQAWELRDTPYSRDAAAAVVDWWDRVFVMAEEQRMAELARLLRETA